MPPAFDCCCVRYEVNPEKIDEIEAGGLEFVGRDESGLRMEIAEIPRKIYHIDRRTSRLYLSCLSVGGRRKARRSVCR